ncbi:unnamed protein product [Rangifer tarandus platyrhynchus]|uniref:Uncharacterized protein n=1 Tax=Rangifer tarandus platyrhynchus TaxID=3082113 RepID=A0AC59ZFE3_RANTA
MPFSRNPTEMCVALREHHLEVYPLPGDGTSSPITTLWVLTTTNLPPPCLPSSRATCLLPLPLPFSLLSAPLSWFSQQVPPAYPSLPAALLPTGFSEPRQWIFDNQLQSTSLKTVSEPPSSKNDTFLCEWIMWRPGNCGL